MSSSFSDDAGATAALQEQEQDQPFCTFCDSGDVRVSSIHGLVDLAVRTFFPRVPFRCRACARRFWVTDHSTFAMRRSALSWVLLAAAVVIVALAF